MESLTQMSRFGIEVLGGDVWNQSFRLTGGYVEEDSDLQFDMRISCY